MRIRSGRRFWIRSPAVPVAAGLLLGSAWLSVSLFFLVQLHSADSLRFLADRIRIDLLECRRREKDFLLRSLTDPAFHRRGTSPYLQQHREAADRLGRESEELATLVPADWSVRPKTLLERKKAYDDSFGRLVENYHRLGFREFGLEGVWHADLADLDRAVAGAENAGLERDLLRLHCAEKEYLMEADERSLHAIRQSLERFRDTLRRSAPDQASALQERLDRYLQDLSAYHAVRETIGLSEDLGLQSAFRTAAHDIEPIVSGVFDHASGDYTGAIRRMRGGIAVATLLLSALLSSTFYLTRAARVQSHRLSESASELSRSNTELQQFAYVASHDLQEPLRAVAGCVQLLQARSQDKLDSKSQELIRHSVEGCVRMQTLIEDLLTLSRIGTREQPRVAVDSGSVLQAAIDNLAVPIQESGAVVTHDDLPTITIDPTQMLQLFQNLIGNAIKFRGPASPLIHVGASRQEGAWRFEVRDNGIGIESKYFERIFRVFQRLHTREEYPGSGIGLAVCQKIVLRLGGRIWLESELNRGSTFYFTIPDSRSAE
ncbi:MAG TPA: ATP-binding protein [Planctomycetota bacterium]|nr:ATP-binding protein [Planctomycetota bacterium]